MKRQTGRTKKQMLSAPKDSFFVWCNSQILYPKYLAKDIGRFDLIIKPLCWLESDNFRSLKHDATVVIDHACELNERAYENYMSYLARLK